MGQLTKGIADYTKKGKNRGVTTMTRIRDRTAQGFTLIRPQIPGHWSVWCEYTPYGSDSTIKSTDLTFTVGEEDYVFPYYWIIVGICGLGLIITVVAAAIKIKHEKIY